MKTVRVRLTDAEAAALITAPEFDPRASQLACTVVRQALLRCRDKSVRALIDSTVSDDVRPGASRRPDPE